MKVQVTALKAPWPEGTKVGDIVELKGLLLGEVKLKGDVVPPYFVGKCTPANEPPPEAEAKK